MMHTKPILTALLLGLAVCALVLAGAGAGEATVEEASLNEYGEVYDANLGLDGQVYISDYEAGQVWKVNPASSAYTRYGIIPDVMNAQPDSAGRIWYTTWQDQFGYIDTQNNQRYYWALGPDQSLSGLAPDNTGGIWMSDFFGSASAIYHFDQASREVCSYTIPGGIPSYSLLFDGQFVWTAEWFHDQIIRLDPASGQVDWWKIDLPAAKPQGMLFDTSGHLWWADEGLGALANLDPATGQMTSFDLPVGVRPVKIALRDEKIWYTEWYTNSVPGMVGILDPQTAVGITTTLTTDSEIISPECKTLGNPVYLLLSPVESGTFTWQSGTLPPVYYQDGWEIYQLPSGSIPYGITSTSNHMWVADQGRQKLTRFVLAGTSEVYIPLVVRP